MSETQFKESLESVRRLGPVDDHDVALLWAADRLKQLEEDNAYLSAQIAQLEAIPSSCGHHPDRCTC